MKTASPVTKHDAQRLVALAIKQGQLKREPCETCADPRRQAHHDDYSKPLSVRWLCGKHHGHAHAGRKPLAKKGILLKSYFTKQELSHALGFSITAINRWQSSGTGPPSILLGGIRLYPKAGVDEWIKQAAGANKPPPKRK